MNAPSFHELMTELLRHFNLAVSAASTQEIYTLHFAGQPDVHIVGRIGSSHIDVMTEAAQLRNATAAEPLLALLELNAYGGGEYQASVSLHRASGSVIVWARQPRAVLNLTVLKHLLKDLQQQSATVRQRLEKTPTRPASSSAATLSRMLQFSR